MIDFANKYGFHICGYDYDKAEEYHNETLREKINKMIKEVIPPTHIRDGLYMTDYGYNVAIAVNNHRNEVAFIDIEDIDKVISYLQKVKENLEKEWGK